MKAYNNLSIFDKIITIILILCFLFWFFSKTELAGFVLFGVVYEMGVFPMILLAVLCTVYFLVRWIMTRFTVNKIYLYGFLLGVLTLLIMRLIYSITFDGITWMPNYKN